MPATFIDPLVGLSQQQQQAAADLGGKNGADATAIQLWRELDHVCCHEAMASQHVDHLREILPLISPWFRCSSSRQDGGIEPVQINREVKGSAFPRIQGRPEPLRIGDQSATPPKFQEFLTRAAADRKLQQIATGARRGIAAAQACCWALP